MVFGVFDVSFMNSEKRKKKLYNTEISKQKFLDFRYRNNFRNPKWIHDAKHLCSRAQLQHQEQIKQKCLAYYVMDIVYIYIILSDVDY